MKLDHYATYRINLKTTLCETDTLLRQVAPPRQNNLTKFSVSFVRTAKKCFLLLFIYFFSSNSIFWSPSWFHSHFSFCFSNSILKYRLKFTNVVLLFSFFVDTFRTWLALRFRTCVTRMISISLLLIWRIPFKSAREWVPRIGYASVLISSLTFKQSQNFLKRAWSASTRPTS